MLSEAITQEQVFIPRETGSEVFAAAVSDREAAIGVVTMGFSTDPVARWVYPTAGEYLTHFPSFIRAFAGAAFDAGTAFCAEGFSGAALWMPPGVNADEEDVVTLFERTAPERVRDDLFAVFDQMGSHHPFEPHWYLPMIGVDTGKQSRGIGTRLMEYALAKCDADGLPAYLESSNPRNMSLYARFGFKVVGQIQAGGSPPIFPMLREAR